MLYYTYKKQFSLLQIRDRNNNKVCIKELNNEFKKGILTPFTYYFPTIFYPFLCVTFDFDPQKLALSIVDLLDFGLWLNNREIIIGRSWKVRPKSAELSESSAKSSAKSSFKSLHIGAEQPNSFKEVSGVQLYGRMTNWLHWFRNYVSPNQSCLVLGVRTNTLS